MSYWNPTDEAGKSTAINQRITLTTRQMHQLRERFLTAAAPYIRIMMDARSLQPVRWIKRPDGHIDGPEIMWQPGWKEIYDQAEQALGRIREEFEARAASGH